MANVAESLARMSAFDADGQPVALGSIWRERPAVVAFVRHFG